MITYWKTNASQYTTDNLSHTETQNLQIYQICQECQCCVIFENLDDC